MLLDVCLWTISASTVFILGHISEHEAKKKETIVIDPWISFSEKVLPLSKFPLNVGTFFISGRFSKMLRYVSWIESWLQPKTKNNKKVHESEAKFLRTLAILI